jgi:hypothetical protein
MILVIKLVVTEPQGLLLLCAEMCTERKNNFQNSFNLKHITVFPFSLQRVHISHNSCGNTQSCVVVIFTEFHSVSLLSA